MEKPNKIAYTIGHIVGTVLIGSVGACISGLAIGLTIKFLMWIF